jgi:geranylgeranyl diphosphate synthase type I
VVAPSLDEPRAAAAVDAVRGRVHAELAGFLSERRAELAAMDPGAAVLVEEIGRMLFAGGKRLRPALCWWAHRAAGGDEDVAVVRAAGAIELLHTFALMHDDVMDGSPERRGVPATHVRFAAEAPAGVDAEAFGVSVAVLVGDLAAALSERLFRACGAPRERLDLALGRFDRMRAEMAAGQLLDLRASGGGAVPDRPRVAALKTASYTTEGPVLVGSALAGAGRAVEEPLRAFARALGEAFQLRDDVLDADAAPGAAGSVNELVDLGLRALEGAPLDRSGAEALAALAGTVRVGGG